MSKAKGRLLSDLGELLPAERQLLAACAEGRPAMLGFGLPSERTDVNTVRASVLAFVAMGGDEDAPVHHRGVEVVGAWVIDSFDFQHAKTFGSLHFLCCTFEKKPLMQGCTVNGNFTVRRCSLPGISLDGVKVRGSIRFDESHALGEVRLIGASLSGMLSFRGASLDGSGHPALVFDRSKIEGSIFLDDGFSAKGGVKFLGARIDGNISLRSAKLFGETFEALHFDRTEVAGDVLLDQGLFAEGDVRFRAARISGNLSCDGGVFQTKQREALYLDRAVIDGDVFFRSIRATGMIRMLGAKIGGNLECSGATLDGKGGESLYIDGAKIEGSIHLTDSFSATGSLKLLGIRLGGDLICSGAQLDGGGSASLDFTGANVSGSVCLNQKFSAKGEVSLLAAKIGRVLDCSQSKFIRATSMHSFSAEGATVAGTWFLVDMLEPLRAATLAGFTVGSLVDDEDAWGSDLILDDFKFGTLTGGSPTDATKRIAWLLKQNEEHLTSMEFKPRPWQHLRNALYNMGHFEDARQVAIALEDHRRKIGLIGQTPAVWSRVRAFPNRFVSIGLHWLFGKLIGYGYRPVRLVLWMMAVWLISAFVYWSAALHGLMGPSNPLVFNDLKLSACRDNWYLCADLPAEYTGFSPLAYSLDVLLPLVDLEQEKDWAPLIPTPQASWWRELGTNWSFEHFTRIVVWAEILFGWVASLLLVAVFSGLAKRRDD